MRTIWNEFYASKVGKYITYATLLSIMWGVMNIEFVIIMGFAFIIVDIQENKVKLNKILKDGK